jgi:hypothetical protein
MAMKKPAKKSGPKKQNPTRIYPDFVDPAADWALGPGIDYFFLPWRQNKDWLPIVILLEGITPNDFQTGAFLDQKDQKESVDLAKFIQFSELGPAGSSVHGEGEYFMASAHRDFFDFLANHSYHEALSKYVKDIILGLPLDAIPLPPSLGR